MHGYQDYELSVLNGLSTKILVRGLFRSLIAPLLIVTSLLMPGTAAAAIHACPDESGSVVYQDRPCAVKKSVVKAAEPVRRYPFNMHQSWFKIPDQAIERAYCDKRGCECGTLEQPHNGSLAQAVADSLYIDGRWHRYETSYLEWFESASDSAESHSSREAMLEASCEVMISQVLIRDYAKDVVATVKKHKNKAEERGFDIDEPCLQGIPSACRYLEYVKLYNRLILDATALKQARQSLISELQ